MTRDWLVPLLEKLAIVACVVFTLFLVAFMIICAAGIFGALGG